VTVDKKSDVSLGRYVARRLVVRAAIFRLLAGSAARTIPRSGRAKRIRSAVSTMHRSPLAGPESSTRRTLLRHSLPVPRSRACDTNSEAGESRHRPEGMPLASLPPGIPSASRRSGALAAILAPKGHQERLGAPCRVRRADHPPQWPCRARQDRMGSRTYLPSSTSPPVPDSRMGMRHGYPDGSSRGPFLSSFGHSEG
jgi:hypothetical protein